MTRAETSSISPTAHSVAYLRAHANISYATEIARMVDAKTETTKLLGGKEHLDEFRRDLAAYMEARFFALNAIINARGARQILEIGSGLSPRGLQYMRRDGMRYVETDLPDMIALKQDVVQKILGDEDPSDTLRFCALDVLDEVQVSGAANLFGEGPLTVVNEGLLVYLTLEELRRVVRNIRKLLHRTGGIWATTDIVAQSQSSGSGLKTWRQNFAKAAGRPFRFFKTTEEAELLITEERLLFDKIPVLSLCPSLHSPMETPQAKHLVENTVVWVMRPA